MEHETWNHLVPLDAGVSLTLEEVVEECTVACDMRVQEERVGAQTLRCIRCDLRLHS